MQRNPTSDSKEACKCPLKKKYAAWVKTWVKKKAVRSSWVLAFRQAIRKKKEEEEEEKE
ncbi:unnamed protein product [Musa hybrid cultivar]